MPLHNRWCSADSKTRPCTRTHDTHAYTHPAEEAARVAGTGQVDPSCTVPGAQLCRGDDGAFFDAKCNQTNLEKNANKYYVIQLVENEDSEYFVFTRWGRFSLV